MTTVRNIPDKAPSAVSLALRRVNKLLPPKGFFLLALVIILLSALAAIEFSVRQALLTEGQIAPYDVVANNSFMFRDRQATDARQEFARKMQPLVLDLSAMPADTMREELRNLLLSLNGAHTQEQREALRKRITDEIGEEVSSAVLRSLASSEVQSAVLDSLLPQAEERLRLGVLPDLGVARSYPGGVLIRNLGTGEESLFPEAYSIPDLKSVELQTMQQIKGLKLSNQAKRAIGLLFTRYLRPTLLPNFEVTRSRAEALALVVEPVMHRILKGEVIIQQGDVVTRDQHIKMRMLEQRMAEPFKKKYFMGIALLGLLMSTGLLFSPSNKPGRAMTNKDFIFLAVLLTVFALLAKGFAAHGAQLAEVSLKFLPESLAYAVPVAGAASLAAQIFTARRYLVTGLLLAFFCTVMMDGGLALFTFYFLAAMWSTWLMMRGTSRQDVVWSILPLTAGLLAMWAGTTMMQGGAHNRYLAEVVAVLGGAFFSVVLTFALAPIVELAFDYTTRFRLMELINLEQPLLRDLMLKAPGTYHHSLIVSNMCEEGAKRVGAHSLLCRVAALYHDIGKVSKAGYFIENQTYDDNPHDRLAPSMSALILISHVKQGVEMAKTYRLGKEITDIVGQHHGTTLIRYFYHKAMQQPDAPPPKIEDFSYPGPKPRSREAAIVMLADIVEASSRTLDDPTPTRLRQHIENMIKDIYTAGQLDESELTFRDLTNLADSFQQVLRGLYHHRIGYPGGEKGKPKQQPVVKAVDIALVKPPSQPPSQPPSATPPAGAAKKDDKAVVREAAAPVEPAAVFSDKEKESVPSTLPPSIRQ